MRLPRIYIIHGKKMGLRYLYDLSDKYCVHQHRCPVMFWISHNIFLVYIQVILALNKPEEKYERLSLFLNIIYQDIL